MKKIGIIVGSLRNNSYNRKIAEYLMLQFPENYKAEILDISELPIYNQDLDEEMPPDAWTRFRSMVREMDSFLFVTPEYNRSIPAAIKNAIDIGSRPYGKSVWAKKAAAIISVTTGALGGFGANHHLRQCMVFLDVFVLPQPEVYISGVEKLLDENGLLCEEGIKSFLNKFISEYIVWIEKF